MTPLQLLPFQLVLIQVETDEHGEILQELLEKCDVLYHQWEENFAYTSETLPEPFVSFYVEAEDTRQIEDFLHHAKCLHLLIRSRLAPVSFPRYDTLPLASFASWLQAKGEDIVGYDDDWYYTDPVSQWLQEQYTAPYVVYRTVRGLIKLEAWRDTPFTWMERFTEKLKREPAYEGVGVRGRVALHILEEVAYELHMEMLQGQSGPTLFEGQEEKGNKRA